MCTGTEACGRCGRPIALGKAEACWYCQAPLCYECWEEHGHCGHAEADYANARARAATSFEQRRAIFEEHVPDHGDLESL